MMAKPLVSLGIAATAFYAPVVPLAMYLVYRNWWRPPKLAWYPFILLSLMRLASGPVLIALANNIANEGLYIAATFLLNVGVIPLLLVNSGFVLIVITDNIRDRAQVKHFSKIIRLALSLSICYLVVGSSLATIKPSIARIFQLLGYGFFALILLGLLARQVSFLRKSHELIPSSRTLVTGALVAAPFLVVRNVYGLLYYGTNYYTLDSNGQYTAHQSLWNPITGNHVAFALMGLLSEYVSICIYFYVGFAIPSK
jgi:putative Mn2+ efflux pump MntP